MEIFMEEKTVAVLVGIAENNAAVAACENSLDELERLLETAGGEPCARMIQVRSAYNPRTCIGSGKVQELKVSC